MTKLEQGKLNGAKRIEIRHLQVFLSMKGLRIDLYILNLIGRRKRHSCESLSGRGEQFFVVHFFLQEVAAKDDEVL